MPFVKIGNENDLPCVCVVSFTNNCSGDYRDAHAMQGDYNTEALIFKMAPRNFFMFLKKKQVK